MRYWPTSLFGSTPHIITNERRMLVILIYCCPVKQISVRHAQSVVGT